MKFNSERQRKAVMSKYSGDNKFSYAPVYGAGDISAMGVDAAGTVGTGVIAAVPLLAGLGAIYVGSDMVLKTKERLQKQYNEEMHKPKTYAQRLIEKQKTKVKKNRYSMKPSDLDYYEWGIDEIYKR
jgi:hypothetical protein